MIKISNCSQKQKSRLLYVYEECGLRVILACNLLMLVFCLAYSSILKMEAIYFSDTSSFNLYDYYNLYFLLASPYMIKLRWMK
jgi:hypothetical protein